MEAAELMQEAWKLAEKAKEAGDDRAAYLLTLAGNLVEATFSIDDVNTALGHAKENAYRLIFSERHSLAAPR